MFSASPVLTLDRYRLFLPLPLTSVNSVRSALKSTLNSTTPLASAGHSPQATIPFRIISFAHPHHLTPIESYSCKKQGRGWYPEPPTQPLPLFSTASKHPTHSNARLPRARARGISTLFMRLFNTSRHTRGGVLSSTRHSMKRIRAERSSRGRDIFAMRITGHVALTKSSLRGSAISASLRYPFPVFPFNSQLSTVNLSPPLFHYSLPTIRYSRSSL